MSSDNSRFNSEDGKESNDNQNDLSLNEKKEEETDNKLILHDKKEEKKEILGTENDKTEEVKTKNNDLILPKINVNCSLKQVQENNINISSKAKKNIEEKNSKDNTNIIDENKDKVTNNEIKDVGDNIKNDSTKNNIENNTTQEEEEKFKEKEEKLLSTFNRLKNTLMQTCSEIEDNLNRIYYPENTELIENASHINNTQTSKFTKKENKMNEITPEQIQKEKENLKKIKNFKSKLNSIKNELNIELNLNNIEELESTYSIKKAYLEKLKKENIALKNVNNLKISKTEIKFKAIKKEELISMNEKISKLKEEAKIKSDYYKTLVEKVKSQNEKIAELQNKCDLITQNIDYYKRKQIKENKKQMESNSDKNNDEDIDKIRKDFEENMPKLIEKQEKLKNKVLEQNSKINNMIRDNEYLAEKVNEIITQINKNVTQIFSYEKIIKKREMQIYDRINKKTNTLSNRKPFHIAPINNNKEQKNKKVFDYQKYLKEYEKGLNKNINRLYTSDDSNNKPRTLKEIEVLKTEIQQSLKNNELDEKINQLIKGLKNNKQRNINNNDDEEEDALQKFLKKNDDSNFRDRYNFYVTEGANLPVPLKLENINKNII